MRELYTQSQGPGQHTLPGSALCAGTGRRRVPGGLFTGLFDLIFENQCGYTACVNLRKMNKPHPLPGAARDLAHMPTLTQEQPPAFQCAPGLAGARAEAQVPAED